MEIIEQKRFSMNGRINTPAKTHRKNYPRAYSNYLRLVERISRTMGIAAQMMLVAT
jgi:hypothetical protein